MKDGSFTRAVYQHESSHKCVILAGYSSFATPAKTVFQLGTFSNGRLELALVHRL